MCELLIVDEGARWWLLGLTVLWCVDAGIRWFKWQEGREFQPACAGCVCESEETV